jgi:IS30 family transposase
MRSVGQTIGRNVSTISRELKRNQDKNKPYEPQRAQRRSDWRRRHAAKRQKGESLIKPFILDCLHIGWSPQVIAEFLRRICERLIVSASWIYRHLYRWAKSDRGLLRHLPRQGRAKRRRGRKSKRFTSIHERPDAINQRLELGHWELDTMRFQQPGIAVVTAVDRHSRVTKIRPVMATDATSVLAAVKDALRGECVNSITVDQGVEFARLDEHFPTIYECDAHSPWQRPSNENTNGLLRRWLPRSTPGHQLTPMFLDKIESLLNQRPRQVLGYRAPIEVYPEDSGV